MILGLKTDQPEVTIILANEAGRITHTHSWPAHRSLARDLFTVMASELELPPEDWSKLTGLVVFKGPGSFTGLRIGAAVANTLAYELGIPIVGASSEDWFNDGFKLLKNGQNDRLILPEYGANANITKPKK